eukprot:m51a1_g7268 putative sodium hydrogen exchanger 3 (584) ;mRNA; r:210090-212502
MPRPSAALSPLLLLLLALACCVRPGLCRALPGPSSSSPSASSSVEPPASDDSERSATLFLVVLTGTLILAVLVSIAFSTLRALSWLHESIAVMLMGTLVGLVAHLVLRKTESYLVVEEESFSRAFYTALFPPIIFNAGFTMKKRMFMSNLGTILVYAVVGTVVSMLVIGMLLWAIVETLRPMGLHLSLVECLLFGTLLSATDTVSTIAHLLELNVDPLLYSIVFGESVLNDAVAITLCHTLSNFYGRELTPMTVLYIVKDFFIILVGSCGIGLACGLFCAFMKARMSKLNLSPTYDITFLVLVAYFSYVSADCVGMSGVISLFVCAIVMSHYCWYTISTRARVSLFTAAGTLDFVAQTIVFFCIGLFLFGRPHPWVEDEWNPVLISLTVGLLFVSRALNVFPLSLVINLWRKSRIPLRHQAVVWWCGMRGVVTLLLAFGLRVANRQGLINATFVVVFFTNIFVGLTTKPLVRKMDVGSCEEHVNVLDPMSDARTSLYNTRSSRASRSAFSRAWRAVDDRFLKPLLGGMPDGDAKRRVHEDMMAIAEQEGRVLETNSDLVHYSQICDDEQVPLRASQSSSHLQF